MGTFLYDKDTDTLHIGYFNPTNVGTAHENLFSLTGIKDVCRFVGGSIDDQNGIKFSSHSINEKCHGKRDLKNTELANQIEEKIKSNMLKVVSHTQNALEIKFIKYDFTYINKIY